MSLLFYTIFLRLYLLGIRLAALKNEKARLWLKGRKNIWNRLGTLVGSDNKIIWFHCASLGEFEQGRPVMEELKKLYPQYKLLLTFFSPSGYEVRKNYPLADWVFYLPPDSPSNAKKFLETVRPSLVVFVKYEFWYHYLSAISRRKIPLLLVSAVFRPGQPFFRWYGSFHRYMLSCFTHIFVQNAAAEELLKKAGFEQTTSIAGDTRFDRVLEIASRPKPIAAAAAFINGMNCIVAGSTWEQDENTLREALAAIKDPSLKLIIAPHEINENRLAKLRKVFPDAVLYSAIAADERPCVSAGTLIIDNIGMLASLYQYSYISYVGGGFTKDGVHNVLEAAVYGKPVLIGPNYQKYREATELIQVKGADSFSTAKELENIIITLLKDRVLYQQKSQAAKEYVVSQAGACKIIIDFIQENRLLTNR